MVTKRNEKLPEVSDASPDDGERTDRPWPYWMMRYLGCDEPDAMEDLIWSVGGSPPYVGVSWDEAGCPAPRCNRSFGAMATHKELVNKPLNN